MCTKKQKTDKSPLELIVSGAVFPHAQLDWICNTWALGVHHDSKEMWQYVEGCMAGCINFYRGVGPVNSDLVFLRDLAAMRRIRSEN